MIAVVLPAYNEEDTIVPLIEGIQRIAKKRLLEELTVIVVDDGSSDETAQQVQALSNKRVILLKHDQNKGLGEAIRTGLLHALELSKDVEIIVTMDSDNTHPPGLLLRMVMEIDQGNDVVIASRYRQGARTIGVVGYRLFLSLAMSWLFKILLPIPGVKDYSSGYRGYRAEILREAFRKWDDKFISQSGFSCMVDILLKLNRLDAIMTEVPLILRYDQKRGKSKMNVMTTIKETLALAFSERFQR
jgi:dolichol-phosphate mannosyltransferase